MAGKDVIASLSDPDVYIGAGVAAIIGATSGSVATGTEYAALVAATAEAAALSALQGLYDKLVGYQWGLFDGTTGAALFPSAIVLQMSGNLVSATSNAPIQNGSFVSYNKVDQPTQIQIGLSFQGSISAKTALMKQLVDLKESTTLVTVIMPEWKRTNVSVNGISFMRTAQSGADLLMPVLTLEEVRTYATTTYASTKTGTVAVTQDMGTVQTQTPTATQKTAIGSGAAS